MKHKWTVGEVERRIRAISAKDGFFPSNQDLRAMGEGALACQVSHHGGFIEMSRRLGIPRRHSDSDTGWEGERAVAEMLRTRRFTVKTDLGVRAPYDLLVNNATRVDVKSARYAEYGACKGWFYRLGKHPQSDVVILFQLDTLDCYILPWFVCPTTNITIARDGGKYKAYRNDLAGFTNIVQSRSMEYLENSLRGA